MRLPIEILARWTRDSAPYAAAVIIILLLVVGAGVIHLRSAIPSGEAAVCAKTCLDKRADSFYYATGQCLCGWGDLRECADKGGGV